MSTHSRRLSILTSQEIDDIYALPRFTEEDRHLYFDLTTAEHEVIHAVHTLSAAVHLTLQIGYFKAKQQFFIYELEAIQEDVQYVLQDHFANCDATVIKPLSKPTRLKQQKMILQLFNYRLCDHVGKSELEQKAQRVAMLSTQPIYILREALTYLANQRIVAPGYSFLQDMVGRAVTRERQRLTQLLNKSLTPAIEKHLATLLEADDGMYRISLMKHEPKDFSYKEMQQEVDRQKYFQPLYEFAKTFLEIAGISNESVKYYASLVQFYTVYKLQRMATVTAYLYLLCFAYHRFRKINDNLVEAFIYLVNQYEKAARLSAAETLEKTMTEATRHLHAAGQVLNLFIDPSIPPETPFEKIKTQAFGLLESERFSLVSDYMRNVEFDKTTFEWDYYTRLSLTFKRNLRHLFSDLSLAGRVEEAPLLGAVYFLQGILRQDKSPRQANLATFPITVIPKGLQRYLYSTVDGKTEEKRLDIDRYEFLIYRLLRNALEAGDLYVKDSAEFRPLEDDLISDVRWQDKDAILRETGAPLLITPIEETLASFRKELDAKFKRVNQRIENGKNRYIKVKGSDEKRRWSLIYPSEEESINSPFYHQLPGIGIADLLWFVAERTGFLSAFTHVLDRYVKDTPDSREIFACIVAMGTNMGLKKMAEVSGLGYDSLVTTARNFLRIETMHSANDIISNSTAALPIFRHWDIQDTLHSSSDGQRLETQINTINARHSRKYFNLKKGVSGYTMVLNHTPINAKIIGTHEHESHFVYDILHNNTTDLKPERHSTDTHGTNQVNFWILLVFGYLFAPRYRDLHKKMDKLVAFAHPSHYKDCLIKPARKVYETLIKTEWPNIQRIMASLAQKDVTQATIVRKLASYARQNQTQKALWELENICRTLYILDYIDDETLRQNVQKALNRGEAYHRLRRAVAYVNSGKFRVKTETEQELWNECSRLIANAIIYYNTTLLSKIYVQKQAANDQQAMNALKVMSPVAWQHINLFGSIEFNQTPSHVDLDALAARYADPDYWNRALREDAEDM